MRGSPPTRVVPLSLPYPYPYPMVHDAHSMHARFLIRAPAFLSVVQEPQESLAFWVPAGKPQHPLHPSVAPHSTPTTLRTGWIRTGCSVHRLLLGVHGSGWAAPGRGRAGHRQADRAAKRLHGNNGQPDPWKVATALRPSTEPATPITPTTCARPPTRRCPPNTSPSRGNPGDPGVRVGSLAPNLDHGTPEKSKCEPHGR